MLRDYFTQDLYIGLVLLCLILVVLVKQLFSVRFIDFIAVLWNDKYVKIYSRDRNKIDLFNGFLFLNFAISITIFSLSSYINFENSTEKKNIFIPALFAAFTLFIFIKIGLERLIGHFTEYSKFVKSYIFHKATYRNISGIVLLIFNIFLLFSSIDHEIVFYSTIIILILIHILGFFRFLKVYQNTVISNFFYFLLYLCALEIGPYVILYKVIKDYFG